jgi:general secretion pathway protein C
MIIAIMQRNPPSVWLPRLATMALAAVLGASLVYWVLRWQASGQSNPVTPGALAVAAPNPAAIDPAALAILMGADASKPVVGNATSRFRLTGVVAAGTGRGAALIAVDGQPPKAYKVGSLVADGRTLQSVGRRSAVLAADAKAGDTVQLELPARAVSP